MTVFRTVIVLLSLLLSACGRHYAPVADRTQPVPAVHKVSRGETVYSIAWMYGLDYRSLARWNGVAGGYRIFPGQLLRLKPPTAGKPANTRKPIRTPISTAKNSGTSKTTTVASKPSTATANRTGSGKKPARNDTDSDRIQRWLWPTRGNLIRGYSGTDAVKKGIDIAARPGQGVIASASGKVVYSGEGLLRYGKLIIIKHNDTYLSAYAHNRKLLVSEGMQVRQGQKIAEAGRTGTDRYMLHFEIRKNGKPVNPLYYLQKR